MTHFRREKHSVVLKLIYVLMISGMNDLIKYNKGDLISKLIIL